MAKIKALVSFAGVISMHLGEVREIMNEFIISDLEQAGFIEVLEESMSEFIISDLEQVGTIEELEESKLEEETDEVQLSELDSVELDKMNATELKAIAKSNGIDLTGCKTNADRIERIGKFFLATEEIPNSNEGADPID